MDEQATLPQYRLIAALSYLLGFITGIIFLVIEPYSKDDFVRFHARQSIAFSVAIFAVEVIVRVFIAVVPRALGGLVGFIWGLICFGLFIFWLFLMYKAFLGERYRIPLLADRVDEMGF